MVFVTLGVSRPPATRGPYCSRVDDLQGPPADKDREQVVTRINRVHDEGRISTADRDIRLGNVRSAQSRAELDLMSRDLDQLEATLAPAASPASSGPYSTFDPKAGVSSHEMTVTGSPRRFVLVLSLVVVLALAGVAAFFVVVSRVSSSSEGPSSSPGAPTEPGSDDPATPADTDPGVDKPGPSYTLSGSGIRTWLATYRKKFGTTRVVDLTFYTDYVIVDVPVPGKARQSGWLYREGNWTGFGGVRATFPGSQVVDTRRLDIDALTRNISRARRTLNVERPAQAYVILRYIKPVDAAPSVDIHVVNKFQESGYLATTLAGQVERAYPYSR